MRGRVLQPGRRQAVQVPGRPPRRRVGLPPRLQQLAIGEPHQDRVQRAGPQPDLESQLVAVAPRRRIGRERPENVGGLARRAAVSDHALKSTYVENTSPAMLHELVGSHAARVHLQRRRRHRTRAGHGAFARRDGRDRGVPRRGSALTDRSAPGAAHGRPAERSRRRSSRPAMGAAGQAGDGVQLQVLGRRLRCPVVVVVSGHRRVSPGASVGGRARRPPMPAARSRLSALALAPRVAVFS